MEIVIPESRGIYPYKKGEFGYLIPELMEASRLHDFANGESGDEVEARAYSSLLFIEQHPGRDFILWAQVDKGTLT